MPIELIARIGSIFCVVVVVVDYTNRMLLYKQLVMRTQLKWQNHVLAHAQLDQFDDVKNKRRRTITNDHNNKRTLSTLLEVGWWKKIAIAIGFGCQYRRRYVAWCVIFLLGCCCLSICLSFFFRSAWLLTLGLYGDYAFNELKYAVLYGACARPPVRTPIVFILNVQNLCEPMRIMRLAVLHPFRWYN